MRRVVITGAGGRDFHNFNTVFRDDPSTQVVAFTAAQIPGIQDRTYPPSLAGPLFPHGVRIVAEEKFPDMIHRERVDEVVFGYSDLSYEGVMHTASIALSSGADFRLIGPRATMLKSTRPVLGLCRPDGLRVEPHDQEGRPAPVGCRTEGGDRATPDAVRRPGSDARAALRYCRRHRRSIRPSRSARSTRRRCGWGW